MLNTEVDDVGLRSCLSLFEMRVSESGGRVEDRRYRQGRYWTAITNMYRYGWVIQIGCIYWLGIACNSEDEALFLVIGSERGCAREWGTRWYGGEISSIMSEAMNGRERRNEGRDSFTPKSLFVPLKIAKEEILLVVHKQDMINQAFIRHYCPPKLGTPAIRPIRPSDGFSPPD